ncbi:MAG: ribosomal protein S18-alanine N-acetyltransferase [Saezia sp.]
MKETFQPNFAGLSTPLKQQNPVIITATEDMLDKICAIEQLCQEDPWTQGNFSDALKTGYQIQVVIDENNADIMGYYVAMKGVDEVHLLNINIAPSYQKQGYARLLLEYLKLWAMSEQMPWIWLEVRQSNSRALHLYEQFGFKQVGQRKNYYALKNGEREDAILMSLQV